jgi:hypothetical protein
MGRSEAAARCPLRLLQAVRTRRQVRHGPAAIATAAVDTERRARTTLRIQRRPGPNGMYSTSSILCDAIKFRSFGGALACSATSLGVECGEVDTDDAAQDCDGDHHDDGRPLSPKLHVSESKQARNEAFSDRHECRPPQRGVPPNWARGGSAAMSAKTIATTRPAITSALVDQKAVSLIDSSMAGPYR